MRRGENEVGRIYSPPPDERRWNVRVESGPNMVTTMKAIRAVFGHELQAAKAAATSLPCVLLREVNEGWAHGVQSKLLEHGVQASVYSDDPAPQAEQVPSAWREAQTMQAVSLRDCFAALDQGLVDSVPLELEVRIYAWQASLPRRDPTVSECAWVPWEARPKAWTNAKRLADLDNLTVPPLQRAELRRQLGRMDEALPLYELALSSAVEWQHPPIHRLCTLAQQADPNRAPIVIESGLFTGVSGFRPELRDQ